MRLGDRNDTADQAGRQWDAFLRGSRFFPSEPTADFSETISRLHSGDDAPAVDPAFSDQLLARLITGSTAEPNSASSTVHQQEGISVEHTFVDPRPRLPRRRTPLSGGRTAPQRSRPVPWVGPAKTIQSWIGLPAILLVIAISIGTVFYGRGPSLTPFGSNNAVVPTAASPAALNAPVTPETVSNGVSLFRGGAARSGVLPGPAPSGTPALAWVQQDGFYRSRTPVVADGRVYLTRNSQDEVSAVLAAIDLRTGDDVWAVPVEPWNDYVPVVADGLVILPTKDTSNPTGALVAFSAETGAIEWTYAVDGYINGTSPALDDGTVYVSTSAFKLYAVDAKTGKERWQTTTPGYTEEQIATYESSATDASLAAAGGVVYGSAGGTLFAVDAKNGHSMWTYETGGSSIDQTPVVSDDTVLLAAIFRDEAAAGTPGRLFALDAASGDERWEPVVATSAISIAAANGKVFIVASTPAGNPLQAYDLQTGKLIWTYEGADAYSAPVYVDGTVYVTEIGGEIVGIDAKSGVRDWGVYLGGTSDPAIIDGLLIASRYDTLYAVEGDGNASAPDVAADLSGLPVCEPPRDIPTSAITGTPAFTIEAETRLEEREGSPATFVDGRSAAGMELPQILRSNVPAGEAASPAVTSEIQETLRSMAPCSVRPEGSRLMQGYFTDDFFRRGLVPAGPDGYSMSWAVQPEEDEIVGLTTLVLADGRTAAVVPASGTPSLLLIFVEQDGHWLIDEVYRIVTEYNFGPIG